MNDNKLLELAWMARENAHPWKSGVKVGCTILSESNEIVKGWNIEGPWMTSIHAEVCAITQLVKLKSKGIKVAIVAETEMFTPCGACIDWLMLFCKKNCKIIIQNKDKKIQKFLLKDLCPFYPIP